MPKNSCLGTVVLEKTLESPLDYKEIQPVHPKGDQSWVFIEGTDLPFAPEKGSALPKLIMIIIGKNPDAGKD